MKAGLFSSTKLRGVATKGILLGIPWTEFGTSPNARAAASDAGRFVASDEMIFLRNL